MMRPHSFCCVCVLTASSALVSPALGQDAGPADLDFFLGHWDVTLYGPNGNVSGRATTHAYRILDGTAIQDDWRSLAPNGTVVFRGTSIRTFVPATGRWAIHWVPGNAAGYTYIDAVWQDGELHSTGSGFDQRGAFRERFRYHDITGTSYTFDMERSYDGGATWSPWTHMVATKVPPGE